MKLVDWGKVQSFSTRGLVCACACARSHGTFVFVSLSDSECSSPPVAQFVLGVS